MSSVDGTWCESWWPGQTQWRNHSSPHRSSAMRQYIKKASPNMEPHGIDDTYYRRYASSILTVSGKTLMIGGMLANTDDRNHFVIPQRKDKP